MEDMRFATSVHVMIYLAEAARNGTGLMSSSSLADGLNANPALIRKLLGPLVAAGLVETTQGKQGGARLARPAKKISLRDIYVAACDREVAFSRENINKKCPISSSMKKVFSSIADGMESVLLKHLDQKSLEDVLKEV